MKRLLTTLCLAALGSSATAAGTIEASWLVMSLRVQGSVDVGIQGVVDCPEAQDLYCFAFVTRYSSKDLEGGFFGAWSVGGRLEHVSLTVAQEQVFSQWIENPNPFTRGPYPIGVNLNMTLREENVGSWYVLALLLSRPALLNVSVSPSGTLNTLQWGDSGVRAVFAHDFSAMADAQAGAGAGAIYNLNVTTERGLLGGFNPWFGTTSHEGSGGFNGPNSSDKCLALNLVLTALADCHAFALHGAPGAWNFFRSQRLNEPSAAGELWLTYVDQAPPR